MGATLSAVGLEDLLQVTQLSRWQETRHRQLVRSSANGHLHRFHRLAGSDISTLIHSCAAFDRKGGGEIGITQIKVPPADLQVQTIGESSLQVMQVACGEGH